MKRLPRANSLLIVKLEPVPVRTTVPGPNISKEKPLPLSVIVPPMVSVLSVKTVSRVASA